MVVRQPGALDQFGVGKAVRHGFEQRVKVFLDGVAEISFGWVGERSIE